MSGRGFGDTVARLASALGIEPCDGCKKRQELLNRALPYRQRSNVMRQEETVSKTQTEPITERDRVVATVRSYIGTPYIMGGTLKGVGVDCATLLYCVYRECGLIAEDSLGVWSSDWYMHTAEDRYLFRVMRHATRIVETHAKLITAADPGNLILAKVSGSRVYNHGAIVTRWPRAVHAQIPNVQEVNVRTNPLFASAAIVLLDPWRRPDVG